MAFKIGGGSGNRSSSDGDYTPRNYPTPKAGNRAARVSLIVDLGTQPREDFEDPKTGERKPQNACPQIAVFADLPLDVVDYGGEIGKQPYRLLLNKTYKGQITGINAYPSPPKDTDGNTIKGRAWGLHVNNILSKVARACGHPEWVEERQFKDGKYIDVSPVLNQPFLAEVKIDVKDHKEGKKDDDGKVIQFKNVSYRGPAALPMIPNEDGEEAPMKVPALKVEPMMIGFDDVTKDQVKWLRADIRRKIKLAENYAGSKMQKAIEAFEAENAKPEDDRADEAPAEKPKAKSKAQPKAPPKEVFDDMDDDIPF